MHVDYDHLCFICVGAGVSSRPETVQQVSFPHKGLQHGCFHKHAGLGIQAGSLNGIAGGLGLAAIQLAQAVGAVPMATAGSVSKREYLRGSNVTEIASSRSTEFIEELGPPGSSKAPNVVLNSLTSPGNAGCHGSSCKCTSFLCGTVI